MSVQSESIAQFANFKTMECCGAAARSPFVSPVGLTGAFVIFFRGFGDCRLFQAATRCAEFKLNMAAVFLWVADDSGLDWIQLKPSGDNVRELFIFKAQRSALDAAMSGRALKALGEVAPVAGGCHGAGFSMRAWRQDSGALLDQKATCSIDCSEAALCARLNQDEKFLCAAPGTAKDLLKNCGRKLAQCIGDEDCVMGLELFRSAQVSLYPQCIPNGCVRAA